MTHSLSRRVTTLLVILALPVALVGTQSRVLQPTAQAADVTATAATRVLLPFLRNSYTPQSPFAVEVTQGAVASVADKIGGARSGFVRYNGIIWSDIETQRGAPDFSKLALVDAELQAITAQGARPIVVVRGTPGWAQQVPGWSCGAIRADARADYARFMQQIVARYSAAPYNVQYWELGNEIDVDPSLVGGDSQFGCWGNQNDAYYGGGAYADMLKTVYPAIKATSPGAQVVLGGLLLDCDPTRQAATCRSGNFLEGVVRNGGAGVFDIVAYHAYTFWNPQIGTNDWEQADAKWGPRGGPLVGKLSLIREVLGRYGVDKPIMMNEGGLLCAPVDQCTDIGRSDQANYAVRMYARSWAKNLVASVWYTLNGPGWYEGGLLDAATNPRPAYTTVQFLARRLDNATFIGEISANGYEGYAFRTATATYRIYWTNNSSTVPLGLPAETRAVYNRYGQQFSFNGTVGFEPIIVESDS